MQTTAMADTSNVGRCLEILKFPNFRRVAAICQRALPEGTQRLTFRKPSRVHANKGNWKRQWGGKLGAGIMAVWQVALVKQLRIMGSNPSQPHLYLKTK